MTIPPSLEEALATLPPGAPGIAHGPDNKFLLTDVENGQRFAAEHSLDLRYYAADRKWWAWDGKRWVRDQTGHVQRLAKKMAKQIVKECWERGVDKDKEKGRIRQLLEMESVRKIKSMIEAAQSELPMIITPEQFDTNPWLLNVRNGTVDLKTGQLLPHKRANLITRLCPVLYDAKAECPRFLSFLHTIMAGDEQMVGFLQRLFGYALTGDTREQCFFLMHGQGKNGKSTLLYVMSQILDEYAVNTPTNTLLSRGGASESISNDLARLKGARLVTAIEAEMNRKLAESLIKQMTGGDRVTARFLWGEYFDFSPEFKLIIAVNHKPNIEGQDLAIWRRIHLIPFDVTIPIEDDNKELKYQLVAQESPGILNWMLAGCLAWQRDGLQVPERVKQATEDYRHDQDPVGEFLSARRYTITPDGSVTAARIYDEYKAWAEEQGERPMSKRELGIKLTDKGFRSKRITGGTRIWLGLQAWLPPELVE